MKEIFTEKTFEKDLKRIKKRGKDLKKLKTILVTLAQGDQLDEKYRDHKLTGNYIDKRECHIEPDWLLIYKITKKSLFLIRTGSHSDLFK